MSGNFTSTKDFLARYSTNRAPVADDETVTATEDTDLNTPVGTLLAGDADADGDTMTVTAVSGATGGTATLMDNGTPALKTDDFVRFTPAANRCAPNGGSYDYTVTDGSLTDTGSVTVNITCVNDAPVAVDDDVSGTEDTDKTMTKASLLANDTDVDSATLTLTAVSNPSGGTVEISGSDVIFHPAANLCGENAASFDYTVSDGSLTDTGTVTLDLTCVNDAPVAVDDDVSGTEDTDKTMTKASLLANDTDVDSATLTLTAVSNPSGGTVEISGSDVIFHPAANLCGENAASFDYTVSDGSLTDTGTVTLDLTCVNDAPVAVDDDVSGTEDTDKTMTKASLLANDTDVDSATLTLTAVSNPSGGTVEISGSDVIFHPAANLCGENAASFDYTVSDGSLTDTGTVTLDLTCVNDAPVAVDDDVSGTEDTDKTMTKASLLANDTDVDSATLTLTAVSNPSGGTVEISGSDVIFHPAANLCGENAASFDYTVSDGSLTDTGTVTLDLTCVNDAPVAVDDDVSGTEDTDKTMTKASLLANDTDVDSATLTLTAVSNPSGGTVEISGSDVIFHPAANLCGENAASFDYTVSDGSLTDTGTVTLDLTCVNDAPVAVDDDVSGTEDTDKTMTKASLLANDTDVDSATLTLTAVSNPSGGTVEISGSDVIFHPAANLCGENAASFDYTVSDGSLTDTGTVTLDLTCVNDAPVAVDDDVSGTEDTDKTMTKASLLANDTDVDSATLTLTAVSNPSGGTVEISGSDVIFHPAANLCGENAASFDYTVSDGSLTDTGTVTLDLTCVNDAPDVSSASFGASGHVSCPTTTGQNNATLSVTFSDVDDTTGFTATIDWDSNPATTADNEGPFAVSVSGSQPYTFTRTHSYPAVGTYTATVKVYDEDGLSDSGSAAEASVTVDYNTSGILQPVNWTQGNQDPSIFKWGNTLPVKVRFFNCDGSNAGSGLSVKVEVKKLYGSTPADGENETITNTNSPDSSGFMRWSGDLYLYNLSTGSLSDKTATYEIKLTVQSTGQTVTTEFGTKAK